MADQTPPDLQDRLDQFSQRGKSNRRGNSLGVGALAAALALGGAGVAYFLATGLQEGDSALETSDVETFQDRRPGTGGRLEFPPDETEQRVNDALIAVEEALDVPAAPAPEPEPSAEVLAEIAKLREALAASQAARNSEIQSAVSDLREAFDEQKAALEATLAAKETELANLQRQTETRIEGLQSMLDAERAQREGLEAELDREGLIADQRLLEERRRQEEEQRQREAERVAEELLSAQIKSPAVVYADGPRGGQSGAAVADPAAPGTGGPVLSGNEQFLHRRRLEELLVPLHRLGAAGEQRLSRHGRVLGREDCVKHAGIEKSCEPISVSAHKRPSSASIAARSLKASERDASRFSL